MSNNTVHESLNQNALPVDGHEGFKLAAQLDDYFVTRHTNPHNSVPSKLLLRWHRRDNEKAQVCQLPNDIVDEADNFDEEDGLRMMRMSSNGAAACLAVGNVAKLVISVRRQLSSAKSSSSSSYRVTAVVYSFIHSTCRSPMETPQNSFGDTNLEPDEDRIQRPGENKTENIMLSSML